jgi:predicted ATPase
MKISQVQVNGLWGKNNIDWNNVDPFVNILVGPNGSGKSTFLRMINLILEGNGKDLDKIKADVQVQFDSGSPLVYKYAEKKTNNANNLLKLNVGLDVEYINTFDIPTQKKSEKSQLMQELDKVIYEHGKDFFSFFDYRMKIINFPEERDLIETKIKELFNIIDSFLASTGKQIGINPDTNKMIFTFPNDDREIGPDELSSGEKQLLLILLKTFLKEEKPFILIMDEPEISLHVEWQELLISAILQLNKNCQIILSTHSPSIFAKGWGDKLVFMEDIVKPIVK